MCQRRINGGRMTVGKRLKPVPLKSKLNGFHSEGIKVIPLSFVLFKGA